MKNETIEKYIEEILANILKSFAIPNNIIQEVKDSVRENIYSVVFHWNNIEFRNAVLITGMEEAKFYEPEAPIDIKCFVVVAIRNSYLEQIFSDDCAKIGMDEPVDEEKMLLVTKGAIDYFKNVDFGDLSKKIHLTEENDKYLKIAKQYPMAWNALIQLGKCSGKKLIYDKVKIEEKIKLEEHNPKVKIVGKELKGTESGITKELSQELMQILKNIIKDQKGILYVDCFKMLTRNFEKLLKVIGVLLENESYFLTSNYMIGNTYIGKREKIYRAAHTTKEMHEKIKKESFLNDLSKTHRTILKKYIDYCFNE